MKNKLAALLEIKAKHVKDAESGNPPAQEEVAKLRSHIRTVEAAIDAIEKVELIEKEMPLTKAKPKATESKAEIGATVPNIV